MKFTKTERNNLRRALWDAIDWEQSLADAHRTVINPRNIIGPRIAAKQYRPLIRRCSRRIQIYRALITKIAAADGSASR